MPKKSISALIPDYAPKALLSNSRNSLLRTSWTLDFTIGWDIDTQHFSGPYFQTSQETPWLTRHEDTCQKGLRGRRQVAVLPVWLIALQFAWSNSSNTLTLIVELVCGRVSKKSTAVERSSLTVTDTLSVAYRTCQLLSSPFMVASCKDTPIPSYSKSIKTPRDTDFP